MDGIIIRIRVTDCPKIFSRLWEYGYCSHIYTKSCSSGSRVTGLAAKKSLSLFLYRVSWFCEVARYDKSHFGWCEKDGIVGGTDIIPPQWNASDGDSVEKYCKSGKNVYMYIIFLVLKSWPIIRTTQNCCCICIGGWAASWLIRASFRPSKTG